jgi:hypothetical protein
MRLIDQLTYCTENPENRHPTVHIHGGCNAQIADRLCAPRGVEHGSGDPWVRHQQQHWKSVTWENERVKIVSSIHINNTIPLGGDANTMKARIAFS